MRKLLLTLTAGFITMGAATGAAQAEWFVHRAPIYRAPVVVGPIYRAPIVAAPVIYTPGVGLNAYGPPAYVTTTYVPPAFGLYNPYRRHQAWERWHREHEIGFIHR
jgi:hypothetical protein